MRRKQKQKQKKEGTVMVAQEKYEMQTPEAQVGKGTSRLLYMVILSLVFMVGLVLSMAFPFGVGVMLFFVLLVLAGALGAVGITTVKLFQSLLAPSISFGFKPTEAYLAGKKQSAKKEEEHDIQEEEKE
jgi:hypothetical protein